MFNKDINVTSHNQSGGITAYSVNIITGGEQRKLTEDSKSELLRRLDKNKKIYIYSVAGNSESNNLATEIMEYLISQSYNVSFCVLMTVNIPKGILIGPNNIGPRRLRGDGMMVYVGQK